MTGYITKGRLRESRPEVKQHLTLHSWRNLIATCFTHKVEREKDVFVNFNGQTNILTNFNLFGTILHANE